MMSYNIFLGKATTNPENIPDEIVWSLQLDNPELVAGMLAAGMGIMDDLNFEQNTSYYIDSDADVSLFRRVTEVTEDKILSSMCGVLKSGEYGLWMKGGKRFYYSLYIFHTPAFFQGVVTICNAFGVDFRNYIYGLPFDGNGNQYAFGGFVMTPYQVGQDAPDLDDDDFDDNPDEDGNIIERLKRTDDIITIKGYQEIDMYSDQEYIDPR